MRYRNAWFWKIDFWGRMYFLMPFILLYKCATQQLMPWKPIAGKIIIERKTISCCCLLVIKLLEIIFIKNSHFHWGKWKKESTKKVPLEAGLWLFFKKKENLFLFLSSFLLRSSFFLWSSFFSSFFLSSHFV